MEQKDFLFQCLLNFSVALVEEGLLQLVCFFVFETDTLIAGEDI